MSELREVPPPRKTLADRFDDAIGFFSPRRATIRKAWRSAGRAITILGYRGAQKHRLHQDWIPGSGSADADTLDDLPTLRERSRDLIRNDGNAASVITTLTTNTIGTGISPQARIDAKALGIEPEAAAELQRQIESAWNLWTPYADAGNRLQYPDLQEQIDRQILENGEVFIAGRRLRRTEETWRPYRFCLQAIESDRVDTPPERVDDQSIRAGVKQGSRGEPLGYYIRNTHPGDVSLGTTDQTFTYYVAKDAEGRQLVWHLYHQQRPGQTRGIPFFAPVIDLFKHLVDYMEAEVVAARVAACFSVFIKKQNAFDAALQRSSATSSTTKRRQTVEPGLIEYLEPDESIETFNPTRPGPSFDAFVIRALRTIGAALGLPYELTAKDFSKTNYSSARAALLEARKYFRTRQAWLARLFCQPVYEQVIEEAYLLGLLADAAFAPFMLNRPVWTRARWVYPGWDWLDPLKEVQASKEAIKSGLSTQADENAARGLDWEATNEQQQRETDDRRSRGLPTWWDDPTAPEPAGETSENPTTEAPQ